MTGPVRIVILGTGGMARQHVQSYQAMDDVIVVGGIDTNPESLLTFCEEHQIEHRFASVDEAVAWGEFDAVSNVTPDGAHFATTMPMIGAGKHVLCEKPLAVNHADACTMAEAADAAGIVHAVNLSYRDVPALQQAASLVAAGDIGEVKHFEASYLQSWLTQAAWGEWREEPIWLWRLSTRHGSNGVLGDVGIHILDFATYVVGSLPQRFSSQLHTFDKAVDNQIGDYTLDANDSFVMHAQLPNGALGTVSATRFASGHLNDLRLRVYGDKGGLEVVFADEKSHLSVCLGDNLASATWSRVDCPATPTTYERFVDAIRGGQGIAADFHRAAALQQLIDRMLEGQAPACIASSAP